MNCLKVKSFIGISVTSLSEKVNEFLEELARDEKQVVDLKVIVLPKDNVRVEIVVVYSENREEEEVK